MTLKEKMRQDMNAALKEKNELKTNVLRMFFSAVLNKEKEKRYKLNQEKSGMTENDLTEESQLKEDEIIAALFSEAKKRREAASEYEKAGRLELAAKEREEVKILSEYMPEQISEEDLEKMAKGAIEKTGASGLTDMSKVMGELMPKVKGRVDGALIAETVKKLLSFEEQ